MSQKLISLLLILLIAIPTAAQVTDKKTPTEDEAKLEKAAVDFLRETAGDVGRMRSVENRISFSAELASLMWFHDEKEAKQMYGSVVVDFKQLLAQLDAEMNSPVMPEDEDAGPGGFLFGGYGKSKSQRKLRIAMAVRQQITTSLAEHAPDLALNFFFDSINQLSNPKTREEYEGQDKYFEAQLMNQIADANPAKASEYGAESLKRGLHSTHIELLKKIYAKDADKGIEFGAAILSRIKTDKSSVKDDLYLYSLLLSAGSENLKASKKPNGKKPIYSKSDLRDIANIFAQNILDGPTTGERINAGSYADRIDQFAPGRGAQIRAKFKNRGMSNSVSTMPPSGVNTASYANTVAYSGEDYAAMSNSNTMSNSNRAPSAADQAREAREKAERQAMDDVAGLGKKEIPKEEREKIIAKARKIIAETKGKEKKIAALGMLAGQVARAGDKDLANEIMLDAERLVSPQPKTYQDFLHSWMLASGLAETNPDKAFPLLEETILRANGTIAAAVKIAEFIDIQEELIDDGEVQVGMFGGSMIRELTQGLGMASGTIKALVKADFVRTRNLTNTFDRPEISILAKMMVLRAVLDKRERKGPDDEMLKDEIRDDEIEADIQVVAPMPSNKPLPKKR